MSILVATSLWSSCSSEPTKKTLSAEQAVEIDGLVEKARALGAAHDKTRRQSLEQLHASEKALGSYGACPIKLRTPRGSETEQSALVAMGNDPIYNILSVVKVSDLRSTRAPLRDDLETQIGWIKHRSPDAAVALARSLAAPTFWNHDVSIVADEWVLPRDVGGGRFEAGRIRGRMYVWSYAEGEVVCASDVDAESSSKAKVSISEKGAIEADLQVNAFRQGIAKLVAIREPDDRDDGPTAGDPVTDKSPPLPLAELDLSSLLGTQIKGSTVFTLRASGTALPHGRARVRRGRLEIVLGSDAAPHCEDGKRPNNRSIAYFDLTPGPGGKFFAGSPFGVSAGADGSGYATWAVRVEVESFDLVVGGRIKGKLRVGTGGEGTFDAEICPGDFSSFHFLPTNVPAKPVSGTFRGKPFVAKTSLATVVTNQGTTRINSIRLFARSGVRCKELAKIGESDVSIRLLDFGGALKEAPLVGAPQPVSAQYDPRIYGSLRFNKLAFKLGATIEGEFIASSHPSIAAEHSAQLAGTFAAKVCAYQR